MENFGSSSLPCPVLSCSGLEEAVRLRSSPPLHGPMSSAEGRASRQMKGQKTTIHEGPATTWRAVPPNPLFTTQLNHQSPTLVWRRTSVPTPSKKYLFVLTARKNTQKKNSRIISFFLLVMTGTNLSSTALKEDFYICWGNIIWVYFKKHTGSKQV